MSTPISEHDGAVEDIIFHENPISGCEAVKYIPTKGRGDFDRSFAAIRVCPKMTI
jgi:hypothetical protein